MGVCGSARPARPSQENRREYERKVKEIVEQSWDFCEQKAAAATDSGVEKKKRGRPLGSKNSKPAQKKPGAKPSGRPPKGCTWSDEKQAYIDDSTGEIKKK